jgi:hypothetical protein
LDLSFGCERSWGEEEREEGKGRAGRREEEFVVRLEAKAKALVGFCVSGLQ